MRHFDERDFGDYAERVLATLNAQAEFFRNNTRANLVKAKTMEAELRKLTTAILDALGRKKLPVGFQRTIDFGDAPSFGDGGQLPD